MGVKKKKKTREYWRKKASTLAKKIARMKAAYHCAYCGGGEPFLRTHGSHIYSEGVYKNMSGDVDNIMCLCASHHAVMPGRTPGVFNWHAHPGESWEWFMGKYPELYQTLKLRTQKIYAVDFEKKYRELKEEHKRLSSLSTPIKTY